MRKLKPKGNHKHNSDKCGVCAKLRELKEKQIVKQKLDIVKETFNDVCEKCGRVYCDHEFKY